MKRLSLITLLALPAFAGAELGKPAPDFALKDVDGKEVRLSSFKGKPVVLEWFNPECPYVKASHTRGSLVDTAKKQQKNGIVWLSIDNSPDGEGQSPEGGKLVNYVDAALEDLAAKRAVKTPDTKAYGCSVKYAK